MGDSATGVAFLVIVAGGAWYLSTHPISSAKKPKATSPIESRAENASESQIDPKAVLEASSPSLNGIKGGPRLLERVTNNRLADSWRSSEIPALNMRRDNGVPLEEQLARAQAVTKMVYSGTMNKTYHLLNEDRPRPMTQGRIRNKFQTTNFKPVY
jgi:hypothetical protein